MIKLPIVRIVLSVFLLLNVLNIYSQVSDENSLVIVYPQKWSAELTPFVQYKQECGYDVMLLPLDTIPTVYRLKTELEQQYDKMPFFYLLLVGDDMWVPAPLVGGAPADNLYAMLDHQDSVPMVALGRFPVETEVELSLLLRKIMSYEKESFHGQAASCGIAGEEQYGGKFADFQWVRKIDSLWQKVGFSVHYELFDGSHGGKDEQGNPTAKSLVDIVNQGVAVMNYVGHGTDQTWQTSQFSTAHTSLLTNTSQWPVVISSSCYTGNFAKRTCLAESLLRASYEGNPAGAVCVMSSSADLPWNASLGAHFKATELLTTCDMTVGKAWLYGLQSSLHDEYEETMAFSWLLFGDPTMRVKVPESLSVYDADAFKWSVYPNPAHSILKVESAFHDFSVLRLFNAQGKCLQEYSWNPYLSQIEIDLSAYSSGFYFLQCGNSVVKVLLSK